MPMIGRRASALLRAIGALGALGGRGPSTCHRPMVLSGPFARWKDYAAQSMPNFPNPTPMDPPTKNPIGPLAKIEAIDNP